VLDGKHKSRGLSPPGSLMQRNCCRLALDDKTLCRDYERVNGTAVLTVGVVAKHGEDEPQAHRRHTHTGFRPVECESTASANSATPAPLVGSSDRSRWPRTRVFRTDYHAARAR